MPSLQHDTLNLLFRDRPSLAVELTGLEIDPALPIQVAGNELNNRPSIDNFPDTVVTIGQRRHPQYAIIVEIQTKPSEEKREQFARYAAALWLFLRCPVSVLVVCLDEKVARWAQEPLVTDLPGYVFAAQVAGPRRIPVLGEPEQVAQNPERAILSVSAHGADERVFNAFMTGLSAIDPDHAPLYYEYAHRLASHAVRQAMEEFMSTKTWVISSPFAREHFSKGEATALLVVLEQRRIPISDAARTRITTCTDLDLLTTWIRRAVTATSTDDLFRGP